MKSYETEARERWGNTDAYREYEGKTKNYTKEKWAEANNGLMAIFARQMKKYLQRFARYTNEKLRNRSS